MEQEKDNLYNCNLCDSKYTATSSLNRHVKKKHDGNKPFQNSEISQNSCKMANEGDKHDGKEQFQNSEMYQNSGEVPNQNNDSFHSFERIQDTPVTRPLIYQQLDDELQQQRDAARLSLRTLNSEHGSITESRPRSRSESDITPRTSAPRKQKLLAKKKILQIFNNVPQHDGPISLPSSIEPSPEYLRDNHLGTMASMLYQLIYKSIPQHQKAFLLFLRILQESYQLKRIFLDNLQIMVKNLFQA